MIINEIWKDIPGYEGLYQVSNYGEVKSLNYRRTGKEKLLKPRNNGKGYLQVCLCKNGIVKFFRINRLVWQTFVGEIPEGLQCNHVDEDKENNRVDNLNLMSSKENNNWGTRNARVAAAKSKPVEAVDKVTGRVIFTFPSAKEAERQGFHRGNISECCKGERKTHHGLHWRYA